jgi:hypothetical protein
MSRWLDGGKNGATFNIAPKECHHACPSRNQTNHYVTIDVVTQTVRLGDQDTKPAVLSHGQGSRHEAELFYCHDHIDMSISSILSMSREIDRIVVLCPSPQLIDVGAQPELHLSRT